MFNLAGNLVLGGGVSVTIYSFFRFRLLVVVDVRLKEMLGDEVVLHAVRLLVPPGPAGV